MKLHPWKTAWHHSKLLFVLGLSVLPLAACSGELLDFTHPTRPESAAAPNPPESAAKSPEAQPASPVTELTSSSPAAADNRLPSEEPHIAREVFVGSKEFSEHRARAASDEVVSTEEGVVLNFVNADIREVAKAVLGDMLHVNYSVAPSVQGNVTIKINHPIPKQSILSVLGTAFRISGAAIVKNGEVVKVVPVAEATRQGAFVSRARVDAAQGFGLQVVSLRYVSAEEMRRILEPVTPAGSIVPVESSRNIVVLAGTEDERAAMMDAVDTFDTDWLSGMSFGIFPLKEASAKTITAELWDVLGTQTGPLGKIIRLVPLDRLNAVLVISSQPRYLREVEKWIKKFDLDLAPTDQKIWVYAVQNGRAAALAETLNRLIEGHSSKADSVPRDGAIPMPPLPLASIMDTNNANKSGAASAAGTEHGEAAAGQGQRVIADESTNSLIIMGTKAEFALMESALKKLDIVPLQVQIEAVIAEVTLTDDLRYGVQYLFKDKHVGTVLTNASTLSVSSMLPGFSAFVTVSKISAILDLLQSVTSVRVISSPQLMVLNNQTAVLQIGDQVPVATQSAVSVTTPGAPVVNSIQLKDTGVILRVTPRVNASGMVILDISQEVSDVAKTTTSNLDSPTIQQRKIASSVAVRDGETIALGGLIKDNVVDGRDGIPILQDIPLAGSLFSSTTKSTTRTELLALITPRVVRNDTDMRNITNEMREQMKAVLPLDERVHGKRP